MGLDMYLNRAPRYKNSTLSDVSAVENYLDWIAAKERGSEYANCTFEEWCGIPDDEIPSQDVIDFYTPYFTNRYSYWDTEKKYGWNRIPEQVGYWRKANQIHNWFVENIQDGEDDCCYHRECTKEDLENLLDICKTVIASSELVPAKIQNGITYQNGVATPCMEDGAVIKDSSVAEQLLPSCSGFFFGGTDYDSYYLEDIKETVRILEEVLATTDFETQMVGYVSSW